MVAFISPHRFGRRAARENASLELFQGGVIELHDPGRVLIVVRVPKPAWRRAEVYQARPAQPFSPIREYGVVELGEASAIGTARFVDNPFVLNRAFIAGRYATEDEGDLRPLAEVLAFPRGVKGVEYDLKAIRNRDPHDRALRTSGRMCGALHRVTVAAKKGEESGAGNGGLAGRAG